MSTVRNSATNTLRLDIGYALFNTSVGRAIHHSVKYTIEGVALLVLSDSVFDAMHDFTWDLVDAVAFDSKVFSCINEKINEYILNDE
jgi:hypothetical protein